MPKTSVTDHVLVVEDDAFFRRILQDTLKNISKHWQVTQASGAREAQVLLGQPATGFRLAIIDLGLPDGDGLQIIRELRDRFPETQILVISASSEERRVLNAIRLGAKGYLVKGDSNLSIREAIEQMISGLNPLSPQIAGYLLKLVEQLSTTELTDADISELTRRERELLRHFASGSSYAETAKKMGVALATVQTHARNLYKKMGVHSSLQALSKAKTRGIL